MFQDRLILRTKLAPPRLHRDTLHRERITKRLLDAGGYRLTVIQAGTGYGKTTALAELAAEDHKTVWYHLDPVDADPLTFLLHLIYGFSKLFADVADRPLALLESWERDVKDSPWSSVIDTLTNSLSEEVNEPVYVILDDAHYLNDSVETIQIVDYLIGRSPPNIHLILATRYPIKLPGSAYWRVRGEILEIDQDELAFTKDETNSLFKDRYGLSLTAHQISLLLNKSEGWPIALQLVRQRLRNSKNLSISRAIDQLDDTSSDLFSYLAQEVLAQQPADIQEFLRTTAILRQMTAATSNCLLESFDSDRILHYLLENDLFVVDLGAGYIRYHHLFRQILLNQLPTEELADFHRRAADCYLPLGEEEEAIYHLLSSSEFDRAANILDKLGRSLVRSGRLENLSGWIGALPPDVLEEHPPLLGYLGDIARLKSRFTEALGWYEQARERSLMKGDAPGVGQALRGQARVYLDTLDAGKAEQLLREALSISEGQEDRQNRARILELLAENLINCGQIDDAEKYQLQARELREEGPAEAERAVLLLLRTGRLEKTRKILETRAEEERDQPVRQPRAHRETPLLLSLVLAFQGDQEGAFY